MPKVLSHAAEAVDKIEVTNNGAGTEALTFIKHSSWIAQDGDRRQSETKIAFVGTRDELEDFVDKICDAMDAHSIFLHNSPSRARRTHRRQPDEQDQLAGTPVHGHTDIHCGGGGDGAPHAKVEKVP